MSHLYHFRIIRLNPSSHLHVLIWFSLYHYNASNISSTPVGNHGRPPPKLHNLHKINRAHPPCPVHPDLSTCLPYPPHPRNTFRARSPRPWHLTFVLFFRVRRPSIGQREEMWMSVLRFVWHTYSSSVWCFARNSAVGVVNIDLDIPVKESQRRFSHARNLWDQFPYIQLVNLSPSFIPWLVLTIVIIV
jgi:hypothetical protein